ncbi:MAG TPA: DUF4097 family beta strand repeat-containing protein [Thermoanaerobaculia bacterium]
MKTLVVTLFSMTLAVSAGAATLNETVDRTFDVKPGANVALTNVNGGIRISSWDQPRVRVIAKKEVDGDRDDLREAMKELRVDIQQRDGGLVIQTHYPKDSGGNGVLGWLFGDRIDAQVQYEVTVPRSMNLDVRNTNGSIRVSEINGSFELDTTNGKIELTRCAGAIDASTTNGSINAELMKIAKGQPLRFETTNGRVTVALPGDFTGEIDAATTNGSIDTDFPVTTTRVGGNSLRGAIGNGGGTQLRVRTTNGSVDIKKM